MTTLRAVLSLTLLGLASAQGLANKTPEVHPKLTTYKCTKRGCKAQISAVVLDASSHPIYQKANPSLGCGNWGSAPNATVCPDPKTCNENCVIDGISDYSAYGVKTDGDVLYLDMLRDSDLSSLSPRVYLLDPEEEKYELLRLTGKEFAFDVDMSKLPCGMNGALYLSEMERKGGHNRFNAGGAKYGNGYCDAQCFTFPFRDGAGNVEGKGACCNEMDIWEANSRANSIAPHVCNKPGPFPCTGDECAYEGNCDEWGCTYNPYGVGNPNFYGRGSSFTLDTTKPFTVVTQFPTDAEGNMIEIRRLWVQDGKVIQQPSTNKDNLLKQNFMDDAYCATTGGARRFLELGGMKGMGDALHRGMVLAMSIWWDEGGNMQWLDGTASGAGPCDATEGAPSNIRKIQPDTMLSFSKIKWGDMDSTYSV